MNNQVVTVNLVPGLSAPAVVRVSQYDYGRPIVFNILDGTQAATIDSSATITVVGTKPSGLGFSETALTISGGAVTLNTTLAMTQESGMIPAEIRFTQGTTDIGTANFILAVEKTPHAEGTTDGTQETMQNLEARLQTEIDGLDDRIEALENAEGSGLTEAVKSAMLQIAQKVAYIDEHGQTYYDALYNALYPPADLVSITAVYTQSGTVYTTASLDDLKSDLTVSAEWGDGTRSIVADTDYTLSGTLTEGTSVVTVSYGGKTASFNVTVSSKYLYKWDFTQSLVDSVAGRTAELRGTNTAPTRTNAGVVFDAATQNLNLGEMEMKGKTVEIDVASFQFAGSTSNHIRFVMCPSDVSNVIRGSGPLIYYAGYGWYGYGPTNEAGTSGTWSPNTYTGLSGNTDAVRNAFNGKTVKIVFSSDSNNIELFVDNESKGSVTSIFTNNFHSLVIGGGYSNWSVNNGDQCYNMTISGVRVYANEV